MEDIRETDGRNNMKPGSDKSVGSRKRARRGWLLVGAAVIVFVFLLITGMFDTGRARNGKMTGHSYKESRRDLYGEIKGRCAANQRSDGRMMFTVPKGFDCKDSIVHGKRLFNLEDKNLRLITVVSDFIPDHSEENINAIYDSCADDAPDCEYTCTAAALDSDDRHTECVRVRKYRYQSTAIFWRFVLLLDKETGNGVIISAYDDGNDDYLKPLMKSVRFRSDAL